jgi:hypothetical protein
MTKSDEFRKYAEEAMHWSRQSKTEKEKAILVELARTWTQAASFCEGHFVSAPRSEAS